MPQTILVLDFDTPSVAEIKKENPLGIILSGGPASVLSPGAPLPDKRYFLWEFLYLVFVMDFN